MKTGERFVVSYSSCGKAMTAQFADVQHALKFGFAAEDHGHSVKVTDTLDRQDFYDSAL